MNYPRKAPEPEPIKHWPHRDRNAFGYVKPACNANWGFYERPKIVRRLEDVTCGRCAKYARGVQ